MINTGGYRLTSEEMEDLRDLAEDQADSEIDWSDPQYDPDYR
ncbi:hypothetical protein VLVyarbaL_00022 [Erwinia phage VyarbaL]|nr:hypothetical protein VLVyarbaL_00022 [Erwinia phage VyarbaL]